jgi:hypothetical protein
MSVTITGDGPAIVSNSAAARRIAAANLDDDQEQVLDDLVAAWLTGSADPDSWYGDFVSSDEAAKLRPVVDAVLRVIRNVPS